jgi:hypothetical protein
MDSAPVWFRRLGYVALWLATAAGAWLIRSAIPPTYQALATVVASVLLAGLMLAILVKQAKPMARTLRSWRDQL